MIPKGIHISIVKCICRVIKGRRPDHKTLPRIFKTSESKTEKYRELH